MFVCAFVEKWTRATVDEAAELHSRAESGEKREILLPPPPGSGVRTDLHSRPIVPPSFDARTEWMQRNGRRDLCPCIRRMNLSPPLTPESTTGDYHSSPNPRGRNSAQKRYTFAAVLAPDKLLALTALLSPRVLGSFEISVLLPSPAGLGAVPSGLERPSWIKMNIRWHGIDLTSQRTSTWSKETLYEDLKRLGRLTLRVTDWICSNSMDFVFNRV